MTPLAAWPLPRVIGVALIWSAVVFLIAFLTPPGRFLILLWSAVRAQQEVNVEFPVTALKAWFVIVPPLAFGPPAALIVAWLRAQGVRGSSEGS